jgi:hypothetical protein
VLAVMFGVGLCCGAPVAGFVLWTAVGASHAAASPEEAAERVVSAMLPGVDVGDVWKYLCDDQREALQEQVAAIRARLAEKFGIHYTLETGDLVEMETADGTQLRLAVALVWSPPPGTGPGAGVPPRRGCAVDVRDRQRPTAVGEQGLEGVRLSARRGVAAGRGAVNGAVRGCSGCFASGARPVDGADDVLICSPLRGRG